MTYSPFSIFALLLFFLFQQGVFAETKKLSIPIKQKLKETETPKPISWVVVPDGSGRSLLVLQGGQVLMVASESKGKKISTFLELSSEEMIVKDFEEGLLGLVFHPQYRSKRLRRNILQHLHLINDSENSE